MDQNSNYELFEENYGKWLKWFDGKDRNSIVYQILEMIWDATAYKLIRHAAMQSEKTDAGKPKVNGLIYDLIHKCFIQSQALAIRRLVDSSRKNNPQGRDFISFPRFLDEMICHSELMTRSNLIRWYEERIKGNNLFQRQWQIDKISGQSSENRSDDDQVCVKVIRGLNEYLEVCRPITNHVNNFLAHAIEPWKRDQLNESERHFNLEDLWEGHKRICQVADFIRVYIFGGGSGSFLAEPHFNQFEYLEVPFIEESKLQLLYDKWEECDKEAWDWVAQDWFRDKRPAKN